MTNYKCLSVAPTVLMVAAALLYTGSSTYITATTTPSPRVVSSLMASGHQAASTGVPSMIFALPATRSKDRSKKIKVHTDAALTALAPSVRTQSHHDALRDAFQGYFAFESAHPSKIRKPYLYFVDYGLSSSTPRGYVFDMRALKIIDGPFMVAQGRGSVPNSSNVPTRFSNAFGSATTSLGLYVAQELYKFTGHSGGRVYHSIGLRLAGASGNFNDNARARGVVAHGAPYVTSTRAGQSEGCPAMAPSRAKRLLPRLAQGGMVFLFAPDSNWMANDPWLTD